MIQPYRMADDFRREAMAVGGSGGDFMPPVSPAPTPGANTGYRDNARRAVLPVQCAGCRARPSPSPSHAATARLAFRPQPDLARLALGLGFFACLAYTSIARALSRMSLTSSTEYAAAIALHIAS